MTAGHGTAARTTTDDLPESVRRHIEINENGCWVWMHTRRKDGYGLCSPGMEHTGGKHRQVRVHRFTYEWFVGQIPAGKQIDHLCRNRACCNPDHLEAVSPRTNTLRGVGPAPAKASQTHCVNGHELSGHNVYVHPKRGTRNCRTCLNAKSRSRRAGKEGTPECSDATCNKPSYAKDLCQSHYMFAWRAEREAAGMPTH